MKYINLGVSRFAFAGAIALLLSIPGGAASASSNMILAQNAPAPQQAQQQFSESQLQAFAKAAVEVGVISNTAQQALQNAQSEEDKQAVMERTNAQQVQAVESNNLTTDEYSAIATAQQTDEQLRTKIVSYMEQHTAQ